MRVLNRLRAAALSLLVLVTPVTEAGAETLADSLVAAYRNSNLLEHNRALLRATDEDVQQAISALYPVVTFAAGFAANSAGTPDYRLSMGLTASIPVLDFGRSRLAIDQARAAVMATRAALLGIEQSVLLSSVQAYMNLFSAFQRLDLQRNNVTVIGEQQRAARERFELGDSTRTDVALAEARLAAARSQLASAEGDVAIAREQFNLVVGRYPQGGLLPPPTLPRLPASLQAAQDLARRNHPAIAQAQHQVTAADIAANIVERQRLGTVSASVSAEARLNRVNPFPETTSADVTASINYSTQLYNGGRTDSAHRQAIARGQAQRAALHQTVAVVQQSASANWARLQIARASLLAADQQIAAAQSAFDAVQAEAELGSRTPLDVLDAEQDLLDARSSRIVSGANLQIAAYALLESTGQMTVASLGLGIATYDVEAYSSAFRTEHEPVTRSEQGVRLDRILGRYQR